MLIYVILFRQIDIAINCEPLFKQSNMQAYRSGHNGADSKSCANIRNRLLTNPFAIWLHRLLSFNFQNLI